MRISALLLSLLMSCQGLKANLMEPQLAKIPEQPKQVALAVGADAYVPKITFDAAVDQDSVETTEAMMAAAVANGAKAIVIEWNTPGGSVGAGIHLSKAIEQSPVPVVCVVDGMSASMGFYLLQSCQVRMMTKRSMLMAHQPALSGGSEGGREEDFQTMADLMKALTIAMIEHMIHRMNVPFEVMEKKIMGGKQWWMNWKEALATGAIDCTASDVGSILDTLRQGKELVCKAQ